MAIFDPYLRFSLFDWDEEEELRGPGLWIWCTYDTYTSIQTISHLDRNLRSGRASKQKIREKRLCKESKKVDFFKVQKLIDLNNAQSSEVPD